MRYSRISKLPSAQTEKCAIRVVCGIVRDRSQFYAILLLHHSFHLPFFLLCFSFECTPALNRMHLFNFSLLFSYFFSLNCFIAYEQRQYYYLDEIVMRKVKSTHTKFHRTTCVCVFVFAAMFGIYCYISQYVCVTSTCHHRFSNDLQRIAPIPIPLFPIREIMHLKCLVIWWSRKNTIFVHYFFSVAFEWIGTGAKANVHSRSCPFRITAHSHFIFRVPANNF